MSLAVIPTRSIPGLKMPSRAGFNMLPNWLILPCLPSAALTDPIDGYVTTWKH